MRLQKFLSRAGVASRRKSEDLIREGRVRVDDQVVTELGTQVDPAIQRIEVDGGRVELRPTAWVALHKPPGVACTRDDPQGRPIIYDLVPAGWQHLFHVGRLDFMSEGLLLLSNDGDVVHRLLHPSTQVERVYVVSLLAPVSEDLPERVTAGVELEDGLARALRAGWIEPASARVPQLEIVLGEGRNREIRRMLAALDVKIRRLCRTEFGPIELGSLASGEVRELSKVETSALSVVTGVTGCS